MKAFQSLVVEFSCSLGSSSRGARGVGAAAWICECMFRIAAAPITSTSSVWNPQPVMGTLRQSIHRINGYLCLYNVSIKRISVSIHRINGYLSSLESGNVY